MIEENKRNIFIIDAMLKGLARWLRILGFDAPVIKEIEEVHQFLKQHPAAVFITASPAHHTLFESYNSYLIREQKISDQLHQMHEKYDIFRNMQLLSRCSICNVPLQEVTKEEIEHVVPDKVSKTFNHFSRCPQCHRVYWSGGHVIRMIDKLKRSGIPLSTNQLNHN